jgi:dipeptidase E
MKLLLTSAGITNSSIADALTTLVGKPADQTKVCLIPTAANVEEGNKDWFIDQFNNLRKYGFGWIDVVDPSAAGVEWRARMAKADVIFVSGGNTFHLLDQVRQKLFDRWLGTQLDQKVYVGVSAGTILATPHIDVATIEPADENITDVDDFSALNLVPFEIEPHCTGERFDTIRRYAEEKGREVYAIDDNTAIQVIDKEVSVISTGKWEHYARSVV